MFAICRLAASRGNTAAAASDSGGADKATAGSGTEAGKNGPEAGAASDKPPASSDDNTKEKLQQDALMLMGVVRVGLFAQRLMLDGDVVAELVIMCAEKPTKTLLCRVATLMANEISVTRHLETGQGQFCSGHTWQSDFLRPS